MNCPACSSRATGEIGPEQFFCRDCCVEFHVSGDEVSTYEISADGALSPVCGRETAREVHTP